MDGRSPVSVSLSVSESVVPPSLSDEPFEHPPQTSKVASAINSKYRITPAFRFLRESILTVIAERRTR